MVEDYLSIGRDGGATLKVITDEKVISEEKRKGWRAKYNIIEYCTALKPDCFKYLFNEFDHVTYLDPDIYVYNEFEVLLRPEFGSIFLTPHSLHRSLSANEVDWLKESRFLQVGVFNLGFISLVKSSETVLFLDWWQAHLENHCLMDTKTGLFVDQKWIDLVPCLFDEVVVLKQPGLNVASWNLEVRSKQRDLHGNLYFIHFHDRHKISRFTDYNVYLAQYESELKVNRELFGTHFASLLLSLMTLEERLRRNQARRIAQAKIVRHLHEYLDAMAHRMDLFLGRFHSTR